MKMADFQRYKQTVRKLKESANRQIITTEDGSNSIYNSELGEHYHSVHGAMRESKHVFIETGWKEVQNSKFQIQNSRKEVSIMEIGFGTGLNAFLVGLESLKDKSLKVFYSGIEAFPLKKEEICELNYAANEMEKELFRNLHNAAWNEEAAISENFTLKKIKTTLENFSPEENSYDLIFFDAFSPEKQPELWTEEIFRKLFLSMKANGIFVTYCAKGQVRRNLQSAGFSVERLKGPPGKREMLRGRKINN